MRNRKNHSSGDIFRNQTAIFNCQEKLVNVMTINHRLNSHRFPSLKANHHNSKQGRRQSPAPTASEKVPGVLRLQFAAVKRPTRKPMQLPQSGRGRDREDKGKNYPSVHWDNRKADMAVRRRTTCLPLPSVC